MENQPFIHREDTFNTNGERLGEQLEYSAEAGAEAEDSAVMQAPTSQRSLQRRSPAGDPGPPPTASARPISPPGSQPRPSTSTKSAPPGSSRRQNVSLNIDAVAVISLWLVY